MADLSTAVSNRQAIDNIKQRYLTCKIDRQQAQREATPIIKRINKKQLELWVKYGKDPKKFRGESFIGLMR